MTLSLTPALRQHEIERIHERSLELLDRVGVEYKTPQAIEILEEAGCPVDHERTWASLPPQLVEWALEQAPRVVRLAARDPERDVVLDGRHPHHTTDSQGTQAIDVETGERRTSTAEDLRRGLLCADALDLIEIVNVMVAASDVPAHVRTVRHFALAFTQTSKHIRTGVLHADQVPYIVDMARAALGSDELRPIFSAVDCTISPLTHDGPMTEACIELAKLGIPILVYPMPLSGATAPVTRAGTVLVNNVEFLSALVLFQLVNPGTPIIYGAGSSQLDMQTGRYGGSANACGLALALCDIARFYNLPINLSGLWSSSQELDPLYGHQATASCLLSYLAGADELYSMGLLGSAQILSLEKMVLDNYLARQIESMVSPVLADEEHLQSDLIERVGVAGHFLAQPETRDFTRREYVPMWPPADGSVLEIAHTEAVEIVNNHQPPDLPPGAAERIEGIVSEADATLKNLKP